MEDATDGPCCYLVPHDGTLVGSKIYGSIHGRAVLLSGSSWWHVGRPCSFHPSEGHRRAVPLPGSSPSRHDGTLVGSKIYGSIHGGPRMARAVENFNHELPRSLFIYIFFISFLFFSLFFFDLNIFFLSSNLLKCFIIVPGLTSKLKVSQNSFINSEKELK